jgi:tRNA pseudouridine38/39 synthase
LQTEGSYDLCEATITGKAFLWHQIRCIMSLLMLIGEGKEDASVISLLLDPNQPKPQYPLASDLPLVLFECDYEGNMEWYFDPEELDRVVTKMQALWTANSLK